MTVIFNCHVCGKTGKRYFSDKTYKVHVEKDYKLYCSMACRAIGTHRKITKTCCVCGSSFQVHLSSDKKYSTCSSECRIRYKTGSKNGNWKGGIKKSRAYEINCCRYRKWRKAVFERDGCKCVHCGSAEHLQADHIKVWAYYPELRYEVSNGRTLCVSCHRKTLKDIAVQRRELEESGELANLHRPTCKPKEEVHRACEECGGGYVVNSINSRQRYCSTNCQSRSWQREWRKLQRANKR